MSWSEDQYLTDVDKAALETKGIRHRAGAIQNFLSLAAFFGLDNDKVAPIVEGIRSASPEEWKILQTSLGKSTLSLAKLNIAPEVNEVPVPAEVEVVTEPTVEAVAEVEPTPLIEDVKADDIPETPASAEVKVEANEVSNFGLRVLGRILNTEVASVDELTATDPSEIVTIIGKATLSGELQDITKNKLVELLKATGYGSIPSAQSTVGNMKTSIAGSGKREALVAELLVSATSTGEQEDIIEPAQPVLETPKVVSAPVPRPPATRPVYAVDVPRVEDENNSVQAILRDSIEHPSIVSSSEWKKAAQDRFEEVSKEVLSEEETEALWAWIHFNENHEVPDEIGPHGKNALRILQSRFLAADKTYFNSNPRQNVAARTLVVTANGIKTLPEICDKILSLKPHDPALNDNIAQRHVVASVIKLLEE